MNINNTTGGVSPLKRRTSKTRAGDVGIKATGTRAQKKGGFSRSGAEGVNTHSLVSDSLVGSGTRVRDSVKIAFKEPGTKKALIGKSSSGTDAGGNPINLPDGYTVQLDVVGGESDQKKREKEFAANCYKNGKLRKGHKFMSFMGYEIACSLDPDYVPAKNGGSGQTVANIYDAEGNLAYTLDQHGQKKTISKTKGKELLKVE